MSNFVIISKEQFESYLPSGFELIEEPYSKEYIYQASTDNPDVAVRIYSSVDIRTDVTRDYGTDAVRIVFWNVEDNRPIGKGKRINRVEKKTSIGDRINSRIKVFLKEAKDKKVEKKKKLETSWDYVKQVLTANKGNSFAESLLSGLEEYESLTPKQLAYVLGDKTPKGGPTFEAQAKKKGLVKDDDCHPSVRDTAEPEEKTSLPATSARTASSESLAVKEEKVHSADIENVDVENWTPTKKYKPHKYKFDKFNPVQSEVMNHRTEDKNMIIGANTSAGKTVCAELLMDHVLDKGERVIYLSPLKSLTQEKYEDWMKRFPDEQITILTGDYVLSEKIKSALKNSNIIVMTSEMCDSRTRKMKSEKNFWLNEVGLVVVDESHILTTNRGHAVETGIMRFCSINNKARVLFLSATMPNVKQLGEWLTTLNGKESTIVYSTWRPVELQIKYKEYVVAINGRGREDYWATQNNKMKMALDVVLSKPDEKFLVFCHDKGTGRKMVAQLNKLGINTVFHNADLDLADRLDIERSFEDRDNGIRVLVSTSTLAWGRNLPARNVVVVGVHRGLTPVDELDVIQMAGRAGRYGIDDAGFVYLIIPQGSTNNWVDTFKNPRPVDSVLNERHILAFHVLAEVHNRVIRDVGELMSWYNRSLSGYQRVKPFERVDAYALVDDLFEMEMLTGDGNSIAVTNLGKVSAWLYFSPYDVFAWYKNFDKVFNMEMSDENLAWAIGDIPSNNLGYVRRDLQTEADGWKSMLSGRGIRASDAIMSVVGAYNCLIGKSDKATDPFKREIMYDIPRKCNAFSLIDSMYAKWDKKDFWKVLPLRVKYGVSKELVVLVKIPGIGSKRATILWEAGFKSVDDIVSKKNRKTLIKVLKPALAKKVFTESKKLVKEDA